MAHQAIRIEPRVGTMLSCNVILREVDGGAEVSAINPVASMQTIGNAELTAVTGEVRDILAKAVVAISMILRASIHAEPAILGIALLGVWQLAPPAFTKAQYQ